MRTSALSPRTVTSTSCATTAGRQLRLCAAAGGAAARAVRRQVMSSCGAPSLLLRIVHSELFRLRRKNFICCRQFIGLPIVRSRWASCKSSQQPPQPAARRSSASRLSHASSGCFRSRYSEFPADRLPRLRVRASASASILRLSRLVAAATAAAAVALPAASLMTASSVALRSPSIVIVSRLFDARETRIVVTAHRSHASRPSTSFGFGA